MPQFYAGRAKSTAMAALLLLFVSTNLPASQTYTDSNTETCLDCHDDFAESLSGSAHRLSTESDLKAQLSVGCTGCHSGWEEHLEDPSVDNIENGSKLVASEQAELCAGCHTNAHQESMSSTDPHGLADVACLDCHSIHSNPNLKLVKDDREEFCLSCHTSIASEFKRRTVHPLESGNVSCIDCHKLGQTGDALMAMGIDWTCQNCHSEVSGPFLHEHPVAYSFLTEGGGCVECHQPHGSPNERLLNQPGDGLCIQCHGTPPKHRLAHVGIAEGFACVDCHSDMHGSYDNSKLLDPDLGMKMLFDCYQCHILGE